MTIMREVSSAQLTGEPPALAGFIHSSFSPLAAEVAARCLLAATEPVPQRTAIVIASSSGDRVTEQHVVQAVDAGQRVGPLLFFQAVPNAVAGYIAAKWQLTGPVVCLGQEQPGLAEARRAAKLLLRDGDADAALLINVEQEPDNATAVLVRE